MVNNVSLGVEGLVIFTDSLLAYKLCLILRPRRLRKYGGPGTAGSCNFLTDSCEFSREQIS